MTKSRMSLAAIVLGASLVGAGSAYAQDPAPPNPTGKASVVIKDAGAKDAGGAAKPAAAAPAGKSASAASGTSRDPFVETSRTQAAPKTRGKTDVVVKGSAPKAKDSGKPAKAPEPVIAPPPVTVHGIVESGRGNLAILVGPSQTWIVKSGDKLGDYHVTKIGKRTVAFSYQDKTFKLPLEADPLSGVSKKSSKPAAPAAPAAPKK